MKKTRKTKEQIESKSFRFIPENNFIPFEDTLVSGVQPTQKEHEYYKKLPFDLAPPPNLPPQILTGMKPLVHRKKKDWERIKEISYFSLCEGGGSQLKTTVGKPWPSLRLFVPLTTYFLNQIFFPLWTYNILLHGSNTNSRSLISANCQIQKFKTNIKKEEFPIFCNNF